MKVKVLVAQSCLTLCNHMDCSPSGPSVHEILQAGILEWVAMPFSRESSQPRDQTWVSCMAGRFFTIWATWEAQKLMRCTENYNPCSWHWSTEWAQFFSTTMPDCTLHSHHFKSWMNWAAKFCLICHIYLTSCQSTTTSSSILTTFCRKNASTTRRRQKVFPKSLSNPKA